MKTSKKILVIGDSMQGKSTLVKKLAFDWRQNIRDIKLLFPIPLNAVKPGASVEKVLISEFGLESEHIHTIRYLINSQPEAVLFIFDGLDEYDVHTSPEVTSVLKGELYSKCCCVVTTRPELSNIVNDWSHVDYDTYILRALSKTETAQLIQKYFTRLKEGSISCDVFMRELYPSEENLNCMSETERKSIFDFQKLASNPGQLGMLCRLCSENHELISASKEKLWGEYVKMMWKVWTQLKNTVGQKETRTLNSIMLQFGALANMREGFHHMKQSFSLDEVLDHVDEDLINSGYLKTVSGGSKFAFTHKGIQEYLAAYFISCETTGEALKHFVERSIHPDGIQTEIAILRFLVVCFLTPEKSSQLFHEAITNNSQILKTFKNFAKVCASALDILSSLTGEESLAKISRTSKLKLDQVAMVLHLPLYLLCTSLKHCNLLSQFSGNVKCFWREVLQLFCSQEVKKICILSTEEFKSLGWSLEALLEDDMPTIVLICTKDVPVNICGTFNEVKSIDLRGLQKVSLQSSENVSTRITERKIGAALPKCSDVTLRDHIVSQTEVPHMLQNVVSSQVPLQRLDLGGNSLYGYGSQLADVVSKCSQLVSLSLDKTNLSKTDLACITERICSSQLGLSLEHLNIGSNDLNGCGEQVGLILKTVKQLISLDVRKCNLMKADIQKIYETVVPDESQSKLKILILSQNCLSNGASELVQLTSHLRQCRVVNFESCQLNDLDLATFTEALSWPPKKPQNDTMTEDVMPNLCHLEDINLSHNAFHSAELVAKILRCLPPTVRALKLDDNEFSEGVTELIHYTMCGVQRKPNTG